MYTSEIVDQRMVDYITKSDEKVRDAIDFLVAKRKSIGVKIQGEQTLFDSMIVKVDHGHPFLKTGTTGRVFIQWLSPSKGNDLIQSVHPVQVRFSFGKYKFSFTSHYITKSLEYPYLGHIITYPESLVIADRRKHDRHEVDSNPATRLSASAEAGATTVLAMANDAAAVRSLDQAAEGAR